LTTEDEPGCESHRRAKAALVIASVVMLAVLLVVGTLGWMMRDRTVREYEIAGTGRHARPFSRSG
jgi:hypothetical protein